jgi:hypothetical protein
MAITKRTEEDKIEIVGQFKHIQVRTATIIEEDGVEFLVHSTDIQLRQAQMFLVRVQMFRHLQHNSTLLKLLLHMKHIKLLKMLTQNKY